MLGVDPLILEMATRYRSFIEKRGIIYSLFVAGAFEILGKEKEMVGVSSAVQRIEPDNFHATGPLYQNGIYPLSVEGIIEAREDALTLAKRSYGLPQGTNIIEEVPHPMLIRTDCVYLYNLLYAKTLDRFHGSRAD